MSKKDKFDPHGEGNARRDIADMSVDDLLNVLSGGTASADTSVPPAEEQPAYTPEPAYSYAPEEFTGPFDDTTAEPVMSEADHISAHFPEADTGEAPPPPVMSIYEAPEDRTEPEEAPAKPAKENTRKLKKVEKKPAEEKPAAPAPETKKSLLRRILDEDPDELLNTRREDPESSGAQTGGNFRRTLYTIAGLVFSVLACIGLVAVIVAGGRFFGRNSSGVTGKTAMREIIYPAVIMDIPSFSKPSELSSNQIITAAIWSLVMEKDAVNKYERTFDVITVPAVDVESYAAKLFGSELPAFEHGNAGPSEARFYYSEENKSYNIPIRPVTFTYSPRIKSVSRSGSEYTLEVEYLEELPEWCGESVKKTVRYVLADTNDGYQIRSMQVLSQTDSMV